MTTQDINRMFNYDYTLNTREKILVHIALLALQTSVSKGETALLVSTTEIGDLADKFAK
jgi:hypothetical protein